MVWLQIECLTIIFAGLFCLSGGVAYQTHEIKCLRRRSVLPEMCFTDFQGLRDASLVSEPAGGFQVTRRRRSRFSRRSDQRIWNYLVLLMLLWPGSAD